MYRGRECIPPKWKPDQDELIFRLAGESDILTDDEALHASLEGADGAIKQLHRLAVMIRQPSKGSLGTKVADRFEKEDLVLRQLKRQLERLSVFDASVWSTSETTNAALEGRGSLPAPAVPKKENRQYFQTHTKRASEQCIEPERSNPTTIDPPMTPSDIQTRPSTLDIKQFKEMKRETPQTREPKEI
ncbi:hypothetical protein AJ78_00850 [Emergomyces pasteurianus Ep9510]|uniref:Uncharacterized protein n=1 Tax=Emergomyces pasteurianus Ep9510 TaxID=1447872 RepID=A0A1J9PSD3_9EURO|nr:hypothetical protein AJ78_00850 [Emergomyces pasteurianus Ep9510]